MKSIMSRDAMVALIVGWSLLTDMTTVERAGVPILRLVWATGRSAHSTVGMGNGQECPFYDR
jgi:hypothetical protein